MIDRNAAVGRIVFGAPAETDGVVGYYGEITQITSKQIHYKRDGGRPTYMLFRSVMAVCDTPDEVDVILAFHRSALQKMGDVRDAISREWEGMVGPSLQVSADTTGEPVPATETRA